MSVTAQLSEISDAITDLMNFVVNDNEVRPDFDEYAKTVSSGNTSAAFFKSLILPYALERSLPESKKSVIALFKEKNSGIPQKKINIIDALNNSFSSVFEIKRLFSNGFELFNLVDEKTYKVFSTAKMNNFRGIAPGMFAYCRIFLYNSDAFLIEISNVMPGLHKDFAYRHAVSLIIANPESAYLNNPVKRSQIEELVINFGKKFIECFDSDEVITTNQYADNIINLFNDYCEDNVLPSKEDIRKNIRSLDTYRYFTVSDFQNSASDFMEKSSDGFSSHSDVYDIGIIYDKETGLFVLPFYKTFCNIYESDDYKSVQGYKDCLKNFLENSKIPAFVIKKVAAKYENFVERTSEILQKTFTLDELLQTFKSDSLNKKVYSSASVLYASKIFEKMMGSVNKKKHKEGIDYSGVGRNDKCPCGSGKKYKNCCLPG